VGIRSPYYGEFATYHLRRGPPTWSKTSAPRSTVTPRWLPNVDGHPLSPLTSYNRGNPTQPTKASLPQQGIGHPASDLRGQDPSNSPTQGRDNHTNEPPTARSAIDGGSIAAPTAALGYSPMMSPGWPGPFALGWEVAECAAGHLAVPGAPSSEEALAAQHRIRRSHRLWRQREFSNNPLVCVFDDLGRGGARHK
jgi:hypothetical protein